MTQQPPNPPNADPVRPTHICLPEIDANMEAAGYYRQPSCFLHLHTLFVRGRLQGNHRDITCEICGALPQLYVTYDDDHGSTIRYILCGQCRHCQRL